MTSHGLIGALLLRPIEFYQNDNSINNKINANSVRHENEENKTPLIEECDTFVFLEKSHQYASIKEVKERPKSIADFNHTLNLNEYHIERKRANRMSLPPISEKKLFITPKVPSRYNSKLVVSNRRDDDDNQSEEALWQSVKKHVKNDIQIFSNIHFNLLTFTYVVFIVNFVAFIIILPDFAGDRGFTGKFFMHI